MRSNWMIALRTCIDDSVTLCYCNSLIAVINGLHDSQAFTHCNRRYVDIDPNMSVPFIMRQTSHSEGRGGVALLDINLIIAMGLFDYSTQLLLHPLIPVFLSVSHFRLLMSAVLLVPRWVLIAAAAHKIIVNTAMNNSDEKSGITSYVVIASAKKCRADVISL